VVYIIIQSFFPELSKDVITAAMAQVNMFVANLASYQPGTFEDELSKLQRYLSSFTSDNKWVAATKFVINVFVIAFEPSTVLHKIEAVMEYVYRTFFKGKVLVPALAA
jgi:small-conductance mechanosensitive channel